MKVAIIFSEWGLPFACSTGARLSDYHWAFSVGPVHFYKPKTSKEGRLVESDKEE